MSFHKQSFANRFSAMGDEAEQIFDLIYPRHHKLGLNRPPFGVGGMTLGMRYTPDRMTRDAFVEVQGIGRDRTLKIKDEKFEALALWAKAGIGPVKLFIWDRTDQVTYEGALLDWYVAAQARGVPGVYPEGKTYLGLNVAHFPTEARPLPAHVKSDLGLLAA